MAEGGETSTPRLAAALGRYVERARWQAAAADRAGRSATSAAARFTSFGTSRAYAKVADDLETLLDRGDPT